MLIIFSHLLISLQSPVIHVLTGELTDVGVHSVLCIQQHDRVLVPQVEVAVQTLEQRQAKGTLGRLL